MLIFKNLLHFILEGFGTANPSSEEDYFSDTVTTFEGSALAVVRWKDSNSKEPVVLRLWTDDDVEVCMEVGYAISHGFLKTLSRNVVEKQM